MRVLILGAGLTGLTLAYVLKDENVDFTLLEARDRIGGRIWTKTIQGTARVEAGATWFGMKHHYLVRLLNELNIGYFPQAREGISLYETRHSTVPQQFQVPTDEPESYRIQGGSSALIEALATHIDPERIRTGDPVASLDFSGAKSLLTTRANIEFEADLVVSTLPPQMFAHTIKITPSLPVPWTLLAKQTHTWMGESIKFFVAYPDNFWAEQSYSGMAFSETGIITEMYDHSYGDAPPYTLKGFLSPQAVALTPYERRKGVLDKLAGFFGPQALTPAVYGEVPWKREPFTTVPGLESPLLPHQNNGHKDLRTSFFDGRLIIGGSETADQFPGYMDGAVNSAYRMAKVILS